MADLSFKHKIMKMLYGLGLKNFGPELLTELKRGSPEWFDMAEPLLEANDLESRKKAIKQLCNKSLLERSPQKKRLMKLFLGFLSRGRIDEKRELIGFVGKNLSVFPTKDDTFKATILGLTRAKDLKLNEAAGGLLVKMGLNMDDKDMYRNR